MKFKIDSKILERFCGDEIRAVILHNTMPEVEI